MWTGLLIFLYTSSDCQSQICKANWPDFWFSRLMFLGMSAILFGVWKNVTKINGICVWWHKSQILNQTFTDCESTCQMWLQVIEWLLILLRFYYLNTQSVNVWSILQTRVFFNGLILFKIQNKPILADLSAPMMTDRMPE